MSIPILCGKTGLRFVSVCVCVCVCVCVYYVLANIVVIFIFVFVNTLFNLLLYQYFLNFCFLIYVK